MNLANQDALQQAARDMGWRPDDLAWMGGIMTIAYLDHPEGKRTVCSLDSIHDRAGWRDHLLTVATR
jgi:hypothetical protein